LKIKEGVVGGNFIGHASSSPWEELSLTYVK